MSLKKLLVCLIATFSSVASADSILVESLNLIRGMDGKSVRCETRVDYEGRAKHGAYLLTNPRIKLSDNSFRGELNIEVQTLRCVKKDNGTYRFELIKPNDEIRYSVVTGNRERVEVRRTSSNCSITVVNDDYLVISESKIDETTRGRFGTSHEIDFGTALSKRQMEDLKKFKKVKLRLGLMKRSLISTRASNGYSDGPYLTAGGIFYLHLELSLKDGQELSVKILN